MSYRKENNQNIMNILVTGSSGFIGSHLVSELKEKGHRVYGVSRSEGYDICDHTTYDAFLDEHITVVFHCAGKTHLTGNRQGVDLFYNVNTLGTQKVLEFCRHINAQLIYLSSYVYGVPQYLPIDENHPVLPHNVYAHSKYLAEELCEFYARIFGLNVVILRPFNIYGKGQREPFLIPQVVRQVYENATVYVNNGVPKRDFLYIDDFVAACFAAIGYDKKYSIFNIGSGISLSVEDIVKTIIKYL